MNRRNTLNILLSTLLALTIWSCNSDDVTVETSRYDFTNVSVKSFSLGRNDSVIANLDTVFFSVDLNRGQIFNADSLPVGTQIVKNTVKIDLPAVSKATLYFTGDEGRDSVDYLLSPDDSVNFANGPVILSLKSLDGTVGREYKIQINVHKMYPDSLEWSRAARRDLPVDIAGPVASRTIEWQGRYYCLASNGLRTVMASALSPADEVWSQIEVVLPSGARISTLTATSDAIYMLGNEDALLRSVDGGQTWSITGVRMSNLYGGYGDQLLGNVLYGSHYVAVSYPDKVDPTTAKQLPSDCPVSGTSNTITYTTEWSDYPMVMMTGGTLANGSKTGCTWAYDGNEWANITIDASLPRSEMSVIPYFAFRSEEFWAVTRYSALFALCGVNAENKNDNTVYMSLDRGVHWVKAPASVQLPDYIAPARGVSAFVASSLLTSRSASVWTEIEPRGHFAPGNLHSRADQLITQWECPYVYLFGGIDDSGDLINQVWRGAINRLTFKPLQ